MKYFIIEADDYRVMARELFRLYENNPTEVTTQFHLFFRATLENWPDFKSTYEFLENKDFSSFPEINMDSLAKYQFWPRADDYPMQKALFDHFISKGVDISADFYSIASQQHSSLGPFQGKYAVMYSEGLINGVFKNGLLLPVYDYLSDRNNNHAFTDRLLYILENMLNPSLSKKEYTEISSRLNELLSKHINSQNPHLIKIIEKIKDDDFTLYPYIKKAILFKDGWHVEKEGISLTLHFDIKKMHDILGVDENNISSFFNRIIAHFQADTKMVSFFATQKSSEVKMVSTFENVEQKKQWKTEMDALLQVAIIHNFDNFDIKDTLAKTLLSSKLHESLSYKNHKQKMKKI